MKYIAITVYALVVLLFSGLARAEGYQSPAKVESAALVDNTLTVQIGGYIPNRCYSEPTAILVQDHVNPRLLTVRLVSSQKTAGVCIQAIKDFAIVADLPMLVEAGNLTLEDDVTYVIQVENNSFAFEIRGRYLKR